MAGADLHFPSSLKIPVTRRHDDLRMLLFDFLRFNFADVAWLGCNQFVYWNRSDPGSWVAPDGFVRFGGPDDNFDNWKVWERGAPEVVVEISDPLPEQPPFCVESPEPPWERKLEAYRQIGVVELIRFEPAKSDRPLRAWDRIGDDLVERDLPAPCAHSQRLDGYWLVRQDAQLGSALRLSRDEHGTQLYPTASEASALRADRAEQRVRELRAELLLRAK